ncbi:MFS transporter [Niabella sp. W65]|nr:MFS transporter [Niabella sp. W65]MCH7363821.1 MFS transporter [Niabella sp. W65]ULT39728.1 MFS transporter [Niabella sp. I65]
MLIAEIFPNKVRGKATSVAIIALWISYALLTFTFPVMAKRMGTYTPFYIYAAICLAGYVFVKIKVKETKGKSLEEMDHIFSGH